MGRIRVELNRADDAPTTKIDDAGAGPPPQRAILDEARPVLQRGCRIEDDAAGPGRQVSASIGRCETALVLEK